MRTLAFSDARNNLKDLLDRVTEDHVATIIKRRDAEDAVVMSLSDYNAMQETMYLLSTPANARHLMGSIAQLRGIQVAPRLSRHAGSDRVRGLPLPLRRPVIVTSGASLARVTRPARIVSIVPSAVGDGCRAVGLEPAEIIEGDDAQRIAFDCEAGDADVREAEVEREHARIG